MYEDLKPTTQEHVGLKVLIFCLYSGEKVWLVKIVIARVYDFMRKLGRNLVDRVQ